MRILITGGAGFIASHIQDAYLQAGHTVAVLDNLASGNKGNLASATKFYEKDLRNPEVDRVLEEFRPEVISHHAAQMDVRRSVAEPIYDCEVNGIGTLNLLEAARKHGVKKVVFASSGGAIYGEQIAYPADESHPTQPASPYGITKLLGEKYLHFYQETYGIDSVALRYANVYGPRQNPHGEAGVVAIFVTKLLKGETPVINGDGLQTRDYVFVEDVVQANLAALRPGVRGIYNVGTGIETNVVEIYQNLAAAVGLQAPAQHGPAKAGEQRRSVISYGKIQKELGWSPKFSLADGLKKTVEYFRSR
ncbi:MAG: NAD-dependent epimerase/dehydratase family protein [Deltaproteobacteria bacterium]|nr:NAD-dependent epimerase/dehydratase family protein [Deltaproteobacteria bacterium]